MNEENLDKLPDTVQKNIDDYRTSVEMYRLHQSGETYEKIGKRYGISRQTVWERVGRIKELGRTKND